MSSARDRGSSSSDQQTLVSSEHTQDGVVVVTLQPSLRSQAPPQPVLYTRRYAMLAMFAALGFLQCAVWNTWGPIAPTAAKAYSGLDSSSIATLALWGPITCITGTIVCSMCMQKYGIRTVMVVSTLLMALGTSMRCLTQDPQYFMMSAHAGAILNGYAGVVVGIAPALLSSMWFPMSWRTTATGIGCTFNQLGNAGGFFLGPLLVHLPNVIHEHHKRLMEGLNIFVNESVSAAHDIMHGNTSGTLGLLAHDNMTYSDVSYGMFHATISESSSPITPAVEDYLRHSISNYMYIVAAVAVGLFVFVLAFFEDEPPTPPIAPLPYEQFSRSASARSLTRSASTRVFMSRPKLTRPHSPASTLPPQQLQDDSAQFNHYYIDSTQNSSVGEQNSSLQSHQTSVDSSARHANIGESSSSIDPAGVSSPSIDADHSMQPATAADDGSSERYEAIPSSSTIASTSHSPHESVLERRHVSLPVASVRFADDAATAGPPEGHRSMVELWQLALEPIKNRHFMLMLFAYSITLGVNVAWSSVLAINLEPLGISQHQASLLGVYITFGGVVVAIAMSRLSDSVFGHLKLFIICLMLLATAAFLWLLLILRGSLQYSEWQVLTSASLAGSLNYAVSPLFFELAMEIGHPTPEDVLGSIMSLSWNIIGLLFFFFMQFQGAGKTVSSVIWMNYALVGQAILVILLMFFVKEEYKRSGPVKMEEFRSTGREGRYSDVHGEYCVSDDSDEEGGYDNDAYQPARGHRGQAGGHLRGLGRQAGVQLLVESSSDEDAATA